MHQPFRFLTFACASLGLSLSACQPQTKPAVAAASTTPPAAPLAATTPPAPAENDAPATPVVGAALKDAPAFLAANNLAPLWQADFDQSENTPTRPTILDGFYGAEHRHISVILERVEQDATQPGLFRVHGRTRYKKNITPFNGTITVTGLKRLNFAADLDSAGQAQARSYTAAARFQLREDATVAGAGTYQGTALLDFYRLPSGKLALVQEMPGSDLPTGGGGLLFRGQWQSVRTGRQQEVAFATYAQAVAPDAMADLYIGDRGENINPKYAGLDWSEAWENDEWWAKSPKPSLSL